MNLSRKALAAGYQAFTRNNVKPLLDEPDGLRRSATTSHAKS